MLSEDVVINFPALTNIRGEGKFFSAAQPIHISRAPGRLDLMGGNVDYTGGLVFESTIREATWAAAQRRADARIVFWNPQMQEEKWKDRVELRNDEVQDKAASRNS